MHFSDVQLCFLTNINMRNNQEKKVDRSEYHIAHTPIEKNFRTHLIFPFTVWTMISIKDMLLTSRRKLISAIHQHNFVAILQREVLPAKKLGFSEIQRHKREFFQKWKLAPGGHSTLVLQIFFMLLQSPGYCQSFEYLQTYMYIKTSTGYNTKT